MFTVICNSFMYFRLKVDEKAKMKKKRLTVAEKVDKVRLEEEKMREVEQQLSAADSQPSSSDQFDRLLMANPNSSELWIAYMAFHLQVVILSIQSIPTKNYWPNQVSNCL